MGVASWQLTISFFVIARLHADVRWPLDLRGAHGDALLAPAVHRHGGSGIAYGLWFEIVRRLPAMTASLGVLSVPVIGVVASMLILGDRPTVADIIGFALDLRRLRLCVAYLGRHPSSLRA